MNKRLVLCGATCLSLTTLLLGGLSCSSSPGAVGGGTTGSGGHNGSSGTGGSGSPMTDGGGNLMTDAGGGNPMTDSGSMGGATGTGGSVVIPETGASVLTRNGHITRDGYFTEPTLTKAAVKTMAMDMAFKATFTGNMMASPLYLEQGPGGTGIFIAVTTNKDIFALDETDGHIVWMKSYGPAPKTTGSPVPLAGFNGTPVIDSAKDPADGFATIYVVGGIGTSNMMTTMGSELHALSAKDGSERAGWPVSITKIQMAMAFPGFVPSQAAQRGSLQLVNGIVYVPYGGYYDPRGYRGWVVAINTADPTKAGAFVTMGDGEGIWSSGGTASDGNGVIAVTGNTLGGGGGTHSTDGESVLRITGLGVLTRTPANMFYPIGATPANPIWQQMDKADNDFGSNSPAIVAVGGKNYVAALSKNGHLFLLDAANFGGTDDMNGIPVGGAYLRVSNDGMQSHTALASYTSSTGAHITFETKNEAGCPAGGGASTVMSVAVSPGPPPTMKLVWCAPGSETSPISTTSDGKGADSIVWFINAANALVGVDGDTGAAVANPTGACMGVRGWTSPIAVKGRIISGADGHLCAWKPM